jgi:hypothetical protein
MSAEQRRQHTEGVSWRENSTTVAGKRIWKKSLESVDDQLGNEIDSERNWRATYGSYVVRVVEQQLISRESCLKIAEQGLKQALDEFCFVRDGKDMSLQEAVESYKNSFECQTHPSKQVLSIYSN